MCKICEYCICVVAQESFNPHFRKYEHKPNTSPNFKLAFYASLVNGQAIIAIMIIKSIKNSNSRRANNIAIKLAWQQL